MNFSEAATRGVWRKKLSLKNLQYSQESWKPATLLKTDSTRDVFLWILGIYKNTYFEEHLLTAASDILKHPHNTGEELFLYWLAYQVQIIY